MFRLESDKMTTWPNDNLTFTVNVTFSNIMSNLATLVKYFYVTEPQNIYLFLQDFAIYKLFVWNTKTDTCPHGRVIERAFAR